MKLNEEKLTNLVMEFGVAVQIEVGFIEMAEFVALKPSPPLPPPPNQLFTHLIVEICSCASVVEGCLRFDKVGSEVRTTPFNTVFCISVFGLFLDHFLVAMKVSRIRETGSALVGVLVSALEEGVVGQEAVVQEARHMVKFCNCGDFLQNYCV